MKTKWVALTAVLALSAVAEAQARPRFGRVEANITAVSAPTPVETRTVTIGSVTLNVTPSTKIEVGDDDERGTFADLAVGLAAEAKYDPASLNALTIEVADNPNETTVQGVLISAESGILNLDTNRDGTADLQVGTDANTQVSVNGISLRPEELALLAGVPVRVEYNNTTTPGVATEVQAVVRPTVIEGQVTAVDATAGTLSVLLSNGQTVNLTVPAGAQIVVGRETTTLSSVAVGDRITVAYFTNTAGTNVALAAKVNVSPRHVTGTITAVDTTARTITVQPFRGSAVVLTIAAGTDLRINGKRVTLEQLATALQNAQTASRVIKVSASYTTRGTVNTAVRVQANARFGGRGGRD